MEVKRYGECFWVGVDGGSGCVREGKESDV